MGRRGLVVSAAHYDALMRKVHADFTDARKVELQKKSKYRNQRVSYKGMMFDSKHELEQYKKLELLQISNLISNLQRQVSFPLTVNGRKVGTYRCDFWYLSHGNVVIADAKSEYTANLPAWKSKKALFESLYGVAVIEL